ncbi:MAG: hypothetical protein JWP14_2428 [Frankiales bacterium]|nr:hypothetical protein [Frankiales bacterium]
MTLPGAVCLQSQQLLQVRDGRVRIRDRRGYPDHPGQVSYFNLTASMNGIVYGDLEGAGVSDAAVPLACDNNGGTADGQLLFSIAIFSGKGGDRHLIGLVTPRVQPKANHVTIIGTFDDAVVITPHRLFVQEVFYGTHDPTCCPSGRATTTWTFQLGRLKPAASRVTRPAR